MYDQYGLDFLQRGGAEAPPGGGPGGPGGMPFEGMNFGGMGGGMPGGTFHFSSTGGKGGFGGSDPMNIFSEFFKQGGAGMGDDDDIFSQFTGGARGFGGPSRGSRKDSYGGTTSRRRERTPEVTTVERPLHVTLEELFKGANKKMRIKRKTFDPRTNKRNVEDKVLDVDVKPGWKSGTKIKFKGVGDQEEGGTQDLHFIITEVRRQIYFKPIKPANLPFQKPHAVFTREDDNLKAVIELDLKEALTGWQRTVTAIDGRQQSVSGGGPTGPGFRETFPNQGMPKSKRPSERGDMIVEVKVKFPTTLTMAQKSQLKEIL